MNSAPITATSRRLEPRYLIGTSADGTRGSSLPCAAVSEDDDQGAADRWWDGAGRCTRSIPARSDTNGDGVGDLRGIIDAPRPPRSGSAIAAIWLSPVTVSPNADCGYDVADFYDVDPSLGTLADLDELVAEAADARHPRAPRPRAEPHERSSTRGSSTSRSSRDNPKRDWYVWADPAPDGGPPNNWVSSFGGPAWTLDDATGQYYLHNFLDRAARPQLVERGRARRVRPHPALLVRPRRRRVPHRRRAHGHQGPRAARQPAVGDRRPTSIMEQIAGSARSLQREPARGARRPPPAGAQVADSYDPPRLLVGETFVRATSTTCSRSTATATSCTSPSTSRSCTLPFEAGRAPRRDRADRGRAADGCTPVWTGSNHDISRFPTRWAEGDPDRARCALMMLLTLRGTRVPLLRRRDRHDRHRRRRATELVDPVGDPYFPAYAGRDPVRTPMQWTASAGRRVHRRRRRAVAPVRRSRVQRRGPAPTTRLVPVAHTRPHRVRAPRSPTCATGAYAGARRARRTCSPTGAVTRTLVVLNLGDASRAPSTGVDGVVRDRHPPRTRRRAGRRLPHPRARRRRRPRCDPTRLARPRPEGSSCASTVRRRSSWEAVQARRSSSGPGVDDAVRADAGLGHAGAAVGLPGELAAARGRRCRSRPCSPCRRPSRAAGGAGRAARAGS